MDVALCAGLCFGLIASFYIYPRDFRFLKIALQDLHGAATNAAVYVDRDSRTTIAKRSVSFVSVILASLLYLWYAPQADVIIAPKHPFVAMVHCLAFTTALFCGPIVEYFLTYGLWSAPETRDEWFVFFRDVFLCPFGEEIFFRGLFFNIFQKRSNTQQILLSSCLFSLSHAHLIVIYAVDEYRMRLARGEKEGNELERICWRHSLWKVNFLFLFTFVFGALSGFYYTTICRGSVFALGVTHGLCNVVGPPFFQFYWNPTFCVKKRIICGASYLIGFATCYLLQRILG